MASLLKRVFNQARLLTHKSPVVVTTSTMMGTATYDCPLLIWFGKNLVWSAQVPCHFIAEKTNDGIHGWRVTADVDGEKMSAVPYAMTYTQMLNYMTHQELNAAHGSGMTGTDNEIIAKRKITVSRSNVLRFV